MKFLLFNDTHIRGTSPRNRTDVFLETLRLKFLEVREISNFEEVDFILHGGDWFDRPDISPSIVREFARIIQSYGKKIYSVAGNHDLYGHNPGTIDRTMLGLLEGIGLVNLLNVNDKIILEKNNIKVQLTGSPYKYDIDSDEFEKYYIIKKDLNVNYAINIIHGMLLKKPFFEGIQYTLIDDIVNTEADVTFAGHYHNGFGIEAKNGKYFINPGSIVRITNTLNEIKRRPKVVILELSDKIYIKEVELKSAVEGENVLDRSILERVEDKNKKLNNFYKNVVNTNLYEKIDIHQIIDNIAGNENISKKVRDEVIRRIGFAAEEINFGGDDN